MRRLTLLLALLLPACALAETPPPPSVSPSPLSETSDTPTPPGQTLEDAPRLLEPPDATHLHIDEGVRLAWIWDRALRRGEYFEVLVARQGGVPQRVLLLENSVLNAVDWFRRQPPGDFEWTVRVVQRHEDGSVGPVVSGTAEPFRVEVSGMEVTVAPPTETPTPGPTPADPPPPLIERLPPGFEIETYARTGWVGNTVLTFGPDHHLYVLNLGGNIARLEDRNGDGYAGTLELLYDGAQLTHAVGMAFHPDDGTIYVSDSGRISILTDGTGDGRLDTVTPIVEGLPSLLYPFHSNNGIAFGPDGKIYVGVGSTSDHGPELSEEYEASILRFNDDGSDLEVFATGFRNPYALVFTPDGDLFAGDNGPDMFSDLLRYLPPEELNHVREGLHYGFPGTYGKLILEGDTSEPPVVEFFPSVVTAGLDYYDHTHFPPRYRNGIFVAQHGTGAGTVAARRILNGFAVVFVRLRKQPDGTYTGVRERFIQFNRSPNPPPRPLDVVVGPHGALYISEWQSGDIYRVVYTGT